MEHETFTHTKGMYSELVEVFFGKVIYCLGRSLEEKFHILVRKKSLFGGWGLINSNRPVGGIVEDGGPVTDAENDLNGTKNGITVITDHDFDLAVL